MSTVKLIRLVKGDESKLVLVRDDAVAFYEETEEALPYLHRDYLIAQHTGKYDGDAKWFPITLLEMFLEGGGMQQVEVLPEVECTKADFTEELWNKFTEEVKQLYPTAFTVEE